MPCVRFSRLVGRIVAVEIGAEDAPLHEGDSPVGKAVAVERAGRESPGNERVVHERHMLGSDGLPLLSDQEGSPSLDVFRARGEADAEEDGAARQRPEDHGQGRGPDRAASQVLRSFGGGLGSEALRDEIDEPAGGVPFVEGSHIPVPPHDGLEEGGGVSRALRRSHSE